MMNKYGEILEDGSMRFVRVLPGPIERVWSWLTIGDKRAQWLCGGGDIAAPGQTIKFDFRHDDLTPHDETIPAQYAEMDSGVSFDVVVTVCEPPRRAVIEWPGARGVPSIVEFQLAEQAGKVTLTITQRGDINAEEFVGALAGWHTHLDIMVDKLSGEAPRPFWARHQALTAEYETRAKDHLATLD